ncbi:GNAT family N-acetyltransferase [Streptomyces meridianus]|uniref:GNAT family N-acetyltransferase n=1 Tax=Streptomyces meridianus TaxID=2938945 RepID=A0ABT0X606_9ACTN|nr:GNAT family N-acetyltransferase [Streptomyces meridianus]MCM2577975.1 GNAT family N-acetyltransferase [Streptomyces meridianus]
MYTVDDALPTVAEYRALREAVAWASPSPEACRTALGGSVFAVVARRRQQVVGMARVVGDRTMYLLVVDVVVHPAHQGAGLGRSLAERVVGWAQEQGARSTLLVADDDVAAFYASLGFAPDTGGRLMRLTRRPL